MEYTSVRSRPGIRKAAADKFSEWWGIPAEIYLDCMDKCISGESKYNWYICLDGERIVGGAGVIENDFHDRTDLTPNVCAVYTDEVYRGRGIAGVLLGMAVDDMRNRGVSPLYLVTDHTGFYERYGWEFLCMVRGSDGGDMTRMYIHG